MRAHGIDIKNLGDSKNLSDKVKQEMAKQELTKNTRLKELMKQV